MAVFATALEVRVPSLQNVPGSTHTFTERNLGELFSAIKSGALMNPHEDIYIIVVEACAWRGTSYDLNVALDDSEMFKINREKLARTNIPQDAGALYTELCTLVEDPAGATLSQLPTEKWLTLPLPAVCLRVYDEV